MMWLSVALGGALGALCRYALSHNMPFNGESFPWATFIVNVVGCFLIGVLFVLIMQKQIIPIVWRPFMAVGFLGALTTFSTFSLEGMMLWHNQQYQMAFTYVLGSIVLCFIAVWSGYIVSHTYIQ